MFIAFGSNKEILIARKNEENKHLVRTRDFTQVIVKCELLGIVS